MNCFSISGQIEDTYLFCIFCTLDTPKVNTICLPLDKTKKSRYDKKDISGEYDAIIAGWGFTTKVGNQGIDC